MMEKKNMKKGIEPVVGTVLLLLGTIFLAGLIFGVIVPIVQNKILGAGLSSCMNAKLVVDTKEGYTCYDETSNKVGVMIRRGADEVELAGLQIIIGLDTGATQAFEINQSLPEKNEQRTYYVDMTIPGTPKEAGVAPIIKMGNMRQLCGITSAVKVPKCSI